VKRILCAIMLFASMSAMAIDADEQGFKYFEDARDSLASYNMTRAFFMFEEAAEMGNADAAFAIAMLYDAGIGVPSNYMSAYTWYLVADSLGRRDAEAMLKAAEQHEIDAYTRTIAEHDANKILNTASENNEKYLTGRN